MAKLSFGSRAIPFPKPPVRYITRFISPKYPWQPTVQRVPLAPRSPAGGITRLIRPQYPWQPTIQRLSGLSGIGEQFTVTNDDNLIFYKTQPAAVAEKSAEKAKTKIDAIVSFGEWLRKKYPDIYNGVMYSRPDLLVPEFAMNGLSGVNEDIQEPTSDWGKTIQSVIEKVVSPLVGVYQQKQVIDLNIKRAEMGLPPIDSSVVAPTVNVSLPYAQQQQLAEMGKYLTIGLLGVGALVLVTRKRR